MKKIKLTVSALMLGIMLVSLVSAFGVSSPYWEGNPLVLDRGESTTIYLNLQNMVGEGDVKVKAILVDGEEFTSLPKEEYVIKEGTSDTMIPLDVSVPKDATPGDKQSIKVEFKTIQDDTGGISMGTGMTVAFDVVAGQAIAETNTTMIITLIVAIIVLIIIIWWILKRKKR